ncbi:asparagine synthase-related protein [Streptomyces marispadix]|uniref:Asparagine synthase-related protein n=1 Tax=Streptomyces marispadix TaxID=2922868 RepID=A0ABS9T5S1_9ACTN|nr:asparagine synthase-related protein [Streptomyces marispadix]MCH6163778.1 asparagine synthase-related protein [Streptomyces marispadix]
MERWWVALPDTAAAAGVARRIADAAPDRLTHASGRPWLLGRWSGGEAAIAEAGPVRAAVLGRSALTARTLRHKARGVRHVRDVEAAVAGPGSYHLLASVDGSVWARGSASAVRRVFTAVVDGVQIAAGDAATLAVLTGAEPELPVLAAHLLDPPVSSAALSERTVWRGVRAVRPDEALLWHRDEGRAGRTVRWWHPPRPGLPLRRAAVAVRAALHEAVATCTSGGGTVSADLSGGLDSTSLCFLASRSEAELVTVRWEGVDPRNDDAAWAARAAQHLPAATHEVAGAEETPDWFAGLDGMRLATDGPAAWVRDVAKLDDVRRRARGQGSRMHLCGGGGDELFTPAPSHLTDLLARHPLFALGGLRRRRTDWRAGRIETIRGLWHGVRRDHRQALRAAARRLTVPGISPPEALLGWQTPPRMPVWATPEAVDAACDVLCDIADELPEPLAPQRWMHGVLHQVRHGGDAVRQMNSALDGPECAFPYGDDAVVAAALSVDPREAAAPGRYKPLLTTAMTGLMPPGLLRRTTKGAYDADLYRALRRQTRGIRALLDDSRLAAAGLIDPQLLGRAVHSHAPVAALTPLMPTLGCEVWLRSLPHAATSPPVPKATELPDSLRGAP